MKLKLPSNFYFLLFNILSLFLQQKGIEIWARPIMPVLRGKYSYGIVFLNRRTDGTPSEVRYVTTCNLYV